VDRNYTPEIQQDTGMDDPSAQGIIQVPDHQDLLPPNIDQPTSGCDGMVEPGEIQGNNPDKPGIYIGSPSNETLPAAGSISNKIHPLAHIP